MSAGDMYLVRAHSDETMNLAIGEPFFLSEKLWFADAICPEGPFTYPDSRGDPELLHELEMAEPGLHAVVTNGAKQAISAAFYAIKSLGGFEEYAQHVPPFWPSYPQLAKKELELGLSDGPLLGTDGIRVITSPNNPDGSQLDEDCELWDAAYAHPVYGFDQQPRSWLASVHSAAKIFGLSGLRVGWLLTADRAIAAAAAQYVERFTSGVAVTSQRHVAGALRFVRTHPESARQQYQAARVTLLENASLFKRFIAPLCDEVHGLPESGRGMFAWFRVKDLERFTAALTQSKVVIVPGHACGEMEPGWFRMSLGHYRDMTEVALSALRRAYAAPL